MKKYAISILAILFAVGSFAFKKHAEAKDTMYFWYKYDKANNEFIYDCHATVPTNVCYGFFNVCSEGYFLPPQNPNTQIPDEAYYDGY